MLTHIHQLIIPPNQTVRLLCRDGMSAATVVNIDRIYNFGGEVKFVECGAGAIWAGLEQATDNVLVKYVDFINKFYDRGLPHYDYNISCDAIKPEGFRFVDHKTFATIVDLCKAYNSNLDI